MNDKLTPRLRTALVQAGYTDPRNGEPSVRSLSGDLDLNNSRVSRYLFQGSNMRIDARQRIADALKVSVAELDSMVKDAAVDTYSPPAAANHLTPRERRLVNDLIHVLTEDRRKAVTEDEQRDSASIGSADDESAQDHTKVTPIFGSGRHLHGVDGEDEEGEMPAAQDKPEGIPPRITHDDD